jgi:uncharacterized protein
MTQREEQMLRVENVSRGVTLVHRGRVANNPWTRFKGLIGVRKLPAGDGLLITPCSSIHCMWMSIPIDVLYCSKDHQAVGVDQWLKPWRIGSLYKGVRYVIELPAGTIAGSGTTAGDRLRIGD